MCTPTYLLSLSNVCSKWETFTYVCGKEMGRSVLLLHLTDVLFCNNPGEFCEVRLVHHGCLDEPLGSFKEQSNIQRLTGKPLIQITGSS